MKMDKWVKESLGKSIDYDNVYGVQCVDLVKDFIKKVLGKTPESIGNAIEYYNKRNKSEYLKKNFTWYDNTADFIPEKGDICVFTSKNGNGHISVASGEGTTSYFYSYDENFPKGQHEPMTKIKHTYSSFLGVLRPKSRKNISSPPSIKTGVYTLTVNRGVYKAYGSPSGLKLVSELTSDGKKSATSKKPTDNATLKKGTKVTIKQTKILSSGNLWAKIPSGYICIWNCDTDRIYIK